MATERCAYGNSVNRCMRPASYSKPLCYEHWQAYDRWEIFECERCHRYDEMVGEFTEDLC